MAQRGKPYVRYIRLAYDVDLDGRHYHLTAAWPDEGVVDSMRLCDEELTSLREVVAVFDATRRGYAEATPRGSMFVRNFN